MNAVDHPSHYTSSPAHCKQCGAQIECIDVVRHLPFNIGNAIKYLWRAEHKGNTVQDLEKAAWYIKDEIARRNRTSLTTDTKALPPLESVVWSQGHPKPGAKYILAMNNHAVMVREDELSLFPGAIVISVGIQDTSPVKVAKP